MTIEFGFEKLENLKKLIRADVPDEELEKALGINTHDYGDVEVMGTLDPWVPLPDAYSEGKFTFGSYNLPPAENLDDEVYDVRWKK